MACLGSWNGNGPVTSCLLVSYLLIYGLFFHCSEQIVTLILTFYVLIAVGSPWYDLHGWLGVKNQLSIYLLLFRRRDWINCTDTVDVCPVSVLSAGEFSTLSGLIMFLSRQVGHPESETKPSQVKSIYFLKPPWGDKEKRKPQKSTKPCTKKKLQYHNKTKNVYTTLDSITHSPFHSTHTHHF